MEMAMRFAGDSVTFIVGDVRDRARLLQVLADVDHVVHAAATKIVPTAEYNLRMHKDKYIHAMNLIDACNEAGVKTCVALSTDKASNPINLYGATKLASDKLFCTSNPLNESTGTRFSVVRCNVMGLMALLFHFLSLVKKASSQ